MLDFYKTNENAEEVQDISKILYSQALLLEGLPLDNPIEFSNLISKYIFD